MWWFQVSIFEKFERNSGFIGGKFLERSRIKNPHTRNYYAARDFKIGQVISINKYQFQLLEADEFTIKFMENNPQVFGPEEKPVEEAPVATEGDTAPKFEELQASELQPAPVAEGAN